MHDRGGKVACRVPSTNVLGGGTQNVVTQRASHGRPIDAQPKAAMQRPIAVAKLRARASAEEVDRFAIVAAEFDQSHMHRRADRIKRCLRRAGQGCRQLTQSFGY
jgi:hypothetical protein